MSSHPQRNDTAYGVDAANDANGMTDPSGEEGGLQGPPNVYHPYGDADAAPVYDAYRDPAAAHGWQNAYDDTVRMEPVEDGYAERVSAETGSAGEGGGRPAEDGVGGVGGHGHRRRTGSRRRPRKGWRAGVDAGRLGRRGVLVAGGVGAVLAAVTVTGILGSGSSGRGKQESPATRESAPAGEKPGAGGSPGAPRTPSSRDASEAADGTSPRSSDGASASSSADRAGADPAGSASPGGTPSAPAASATTSEANRGNSGNNPGHGQGSTKKPK